MEIQKNQDKVSLPFVRQTSTENRAEILPEYQTDADTSSSSKIL